MEIIQVSLKISRYLNVSCDFYLFNQTFDLKKTKKLKLKRFSKSLNQYLKGESFICSVWTVQTNRFSSDFLSTYYDATTEIYRIFSTTEENGGVHVQRLSCILSFVISSRNTHVLQCITLHRTSQNKWLLWG